MKKILQKKKIQSRIIVTLLTLAMLFTNMSMTSFAAEVQPPVDVDNISTLVEAVPEIASQTDNRNQGIMPMGIGGYAAKYTSSMRGSFTVNAPGDGNGSGTLQITTHEFSTSPTINIVLYRPDGTCAGEIYINGNATKQMRFSNAMSGNYTIVYSVASNVGGWISAWVSS